MSVCHWFPDPLRLVEALASKPVAASWLSGTSPEGVSGWLQVSPDFMCALNCAEVAPDAAPFDTYCATIAALLQTGAEEQCASGRGHDNQGAVHVPEVFIQFPLGQTWLLYCGTYLPLMVEIGLLAPRHHHRIPVKVGAEACAEASADACAEDDVESGAGGEVDMAVQMCSRPLYACALWPDSLAVDAIIASHIPSLNALALMKRSPQQYAAHLTGVGTAATCATGAAVGAQRAPMSVAFLRPGNPFYEVTQRVWACLADHGLTNSATWPAGRLPVLLLSCSAQTGMSVVQVWWSAFPKVCPTDTLDVFGWPVPDLRVVPVTPLSGLVLAPEGSETTVFGARTSVTFPLPKSVMTSPPLLHAWHSLGLQVVATRAKTAPGLVVKGTVAAVRNGTLALAQHLVSAKDEAWGRGLARSSGPGDAASQQEVAGRPLWGRNPFENVTREDLQGFRFAVATDMAAGAQLAACLRDLFMRGVLDVTSGFQELPLPLRVLTAWHIRPQAAAEFPFEELWYSSGSPGDSLWFTCAEQILAAHADLLLPCHHRLDQQGVVCRLVTFLYLNVSVVSFPLGNHLCFSDGAPRTSQQPPQFSSPSSFSSSSSSALSSSSSSSSISPWSSWSATFGSPEACLPVEGSFSAPETVNLGLVCAPAGSEVADTPGGEHGASSSDPDMGDLMSGTRAWQFAFAEEEPDDSTLEDDVQGMRGHIPRGPTPSNIEPLPGAKHKVPQGRGQVPAPGRVKPKERLLGDKRHRIPGLTSALNKV